MSTATTTNKTADKLEAMADRLQKDIDNARRPLTQNPTPKRQREYHGRLLDADNWERGQRAMRAIASAIRQGSLADCLHGVATKDAILGLVRHRLESNGYYDIHDSGEYADSSLAGRTLQEMITYHTSPEQQAADADRMQAHEIARMVDALRFQDIPGFFPTPGPVIDAMLTVADIQPGMTVLEPSAGIGSIADAIRSKHPDAKLCCCEIRPTLREILTKKGHTLTNVDDFLTLQVPEYYAHPGVKAALGFDRIVMNPPFENLQDTDHVRHAYASLRPGGRLVAIMSPSGFFNGRRKGEEFRAWFTEVQGEKTDLPHGLFKLPGTFRQTGVATVMVAIHKPL